MICRNMRFSCDRSNVGIDCTVSVLMAGSAGWILRFLLVVGPCFMLKMRMWKIGQGFCFIVFLLNKDRSKNRCMLLLLASMALNLVRYVKCDDVYRMRVLCSPFAINEFSLREVTMRASPWLSALRTHSFPVLSKET